MEYLQYTTEENEITLEKMVRGFKPYYKWNTFNTWVKIYCQPIN